MDGLYFQNITDSNIRFLVDGSGSMSACICGEVVMQNGFGIYGKRNIFGAKTCALTRMESLQNELISLLTT